MDNRESSCIGCGLDPVIEVNDRKLCGNCFLLGISVSLQPANSAPAERAPDRLSGDPSHMRELRSSLLTAIDEIERLRHRLDELVRENATLRRNDGGTYPQGPSEDHRSKD